MIYTKRIGCQTFKIKTPPKDYDCTRASLLVQARHGRAFVPLLSFDGKEARMHSSKYHRDLARWILDTLAGD